MDDGALFIGYRAEIVVEILNMYVCGVSMIAIAVHTGMNVTEVNEILDEYAPHLEG